LKIPASAFRFAQCGCLFSAAAEKAAKLLRSLSSRHPHLFLNKCRIHSRRNVHPHFFFRKNEGTGIAFPGSALFFEFFHLTGKNI